MGFNEIINDMSLKKKVVGSAALLIILIFTVGFTGFFGIYSIKENMDNGLVLNVAAGDSAMKMDIAVRTAIDAAEKYFLGKKEAKNEFRNLITEFDTFETELESMDLDYEERKSLDTIIKLHGQFEDAGLKFFDAVDESNNGADDSSVLAAFDKFDASAGELITALSKFRDMQAVEAETAKKETENLYQFAIKSLIILTIMSAALGFWSSVALSRSVTEPVINLLSASNQIAGGDLTGEISYKSNDEIGQLCATTRKMVINLRELVGHIQQNAAKVSASADLMSASIEVMNVSMEEMNKTSEQLRNGSHSVAIASQQIAAGAQQQSERINEVSGALSDMSSGIQRVANNSHRAAEGTEAANNLTEEVSKVAKKLAEKMDEIEWSVGESAKAIRELESKSSQIGEIVRMIKGIADQTNLLALNAAIEAARAGEHGRGFAVVADEVRSLAEESGNAAKQIEGLIKEVQKGTEKAVSSMEIGTAEVAAGGESLKSTMDSLKRVIEAIRNAYYLVQEISAATEEQAASIEEITRSIQDVSAISEETASGSQETSATSQQQSSAIEQQVDAIDDITAVMNQLATSSKDLAVMSDNLEGALKQFRLGSSSSSTE